MYRKSELVEGFVDTKCLLIVADYEIKFLVEKDEDDQTVQNAIKFAIKYHAAMVPKRVKYQQSYHKRASATKKVTR